MKKILSVDIETYSDIEITKGVYRYVDTPNFEILLFAYAYDDSPVEIIDLACGETLPQEVIDDLQNNSIEKHAYNAQFERICLSKYLGIKGYLDPSQWYCTMVKAMYLGLPGKLGEVSKALNLEEQKDTAGTLLIKYFSVPCKPSKANGQRTRNLPHHDFAKWDLFVSYCKQDVVTERAISKRLEFYPITETERRLYIMDQRINDCGIEVDLDLTNTIINFNNEYVEKLNDRAQEITGLDNPNSIAQLKDWLIDEGLELDSLTKAKVAELLESNLDDHIQEVLELRQDMSKTSVKKYEMLQTATCSDSRIRGVLQFMGANRTGRWAGRLVQVQNLPQNKYEEIDALRGLVKNQEFDYLMDAYPSITNIFSQLIRTSFVAPEAKTFAIADYSAIEARVIAWLADETWVMDVFANEGDIYKATASKMFDVPIENIDKQLRAKGKVATLALGYQGSTGALEAMGALKMGIPQDELSGIVKAWRKTNKNIVKLWKTYNDAAIQVIKTGNSIQLKHGIKFLRDDDFFYIELPSRRRLSYFKPSLSGNDGYTKIKYQGVEQSKRTWGSKDTYGGKLVENVVQAIARDCLAEAMLLVHCEYPIVMHVHDELIAEVDELVSNQKLEQIKCLMNTRSTPLQWAPGLYLKAEGYCSKFYKKD
ncbi:MAG: DNA polymerase [Anaerorhabdus sp.]|uniref:DNA polymerase n=1 Tax=Anaerorhabdus sp. TaxID=1872524 RepID=UPI003A887DC2